MNFALSPEQESFVAAVRTFARERVAPAAARIDAEGTFPRELVAEAATLGLAGITVGPEQGGAGRDYVSYAHAMESIAQASATVAVILSVNNSLVVEPIVEHGTPEQREQWVSRLASGRALGAFALSEAQAGSDAANQLTIARADGGDFLITGTKVWVANALAAEVAIVFAVTDATAKTRGISAFLVPLSSPGITTRATDSLGMRGLGCLDLEFRDVRVPASALLGEPGRGFRLAMRALEGGRIAIAAQALGIGQAALQEALEYSRRRQAFGQPIGDFQAVQFQLADLATELEAARMLIWGAASLHDSSGRAALEAAMAKLHASESAHRAADRAMQILASEGYRRGSTVERLFRDVRAAEIYQGTSEVQRMVIAEKLLDRGR